jgi:hypothetical protein
MTRCSLSIHMKLFSSSSSPACRPWILELADRGSYLASRSQFVIWLSIFEICANNFILSTDTFPTLDPCRPYVLHPSPPVCPTVHVHRTAVRMPRHGTSWNEPNFCKWKSDSLHLHDSPKKRLSRAIPVSSGTNPYIAVIKETLHYIIQHQNTTLRHKLGTSPIGLNQER